MAMMNMQPSLTNWTRLEKFACISVCILFVISMCAGILLPIYTDEVVSKIYHSRLFDEGLANWTTGLPQCATSFHTPLPVALYFGALVSSLTYYNVDPVLLRLIGMLNIPILVAIFVYLVRKISNGRVSYLEACGVVVSILGLGVLPFLLIIDRPEQILILSLLFFIVAPMLAKNKSPFIKLSITGLFIAATSIFFFAHSLALFFIPVIFVSAGYLAWSQNNRFVIMTVLFAIVAYTAFQSYHYSKDFTQCDDAPIVGEIMRSGTLDPHLLVTRPKEFLKNGLRNVLTASPAIVTRAALARRYQSDWLPANTTLHSDYFLLLVIAVTMAIFGLLLYGAIVLLVMRVVYCIRQRSIDFNTAIAMSLAAGLFTHEFFYNTWNFYTASLVICVSFMIALLSLSSFSLCEKNRRHARALFLLVMVVSLFSQVELLKTTLPQLAAIPSASTKIAEQPLSIPVFSYRANKEQIYQAGQACQIRQADKNTHLVVDDFTSFAFLRADEPILISYISGFFGRDIGEGGLVDFLKSTGSAGLITRCSSLPQGLLNRDIHRVGDFCCIGHEYAENINQ